MEYTSSRRGPRFCVSHENFPTKVSAYLVNKRRHDPGPGELRCKVLDALRAGDQVQKQDSLLGNTARLENIDSHDSGTAYQEFKHGGLEQTLLVFGLR